MLKLCGTDKKKILELDSGGDNGHTTANVLNATELYFKVLKMVLLYCILLQ